MKCLWHRVFADHSFRLEGSLMRKIFSALLAFALILSMMPTIPITVHATDPHYTYTTYEGRTATITGCDTSVSGDIVIPELMGGYYKVTRIGDYAFRDCKNITSIIIPDGVTSIGTSAFSGCTNLTSITIPDTVTSIGKNAFDGCSKLMSITIPDSVVSIADGAFYGCSSLTDVTIPSSITGISNSTFGGCSGLTSITIPDSVTSIGDYAFSGCSKLASITIPDSITHIGYHTFYNCNGLTFNTYDNATYLEYAANPYYALVDVSSASITSCKIHKDTKIIGAVFDKCNYLTSVIIEKGVTRISDHAFSNCYKLTNITIPDSVIDIGDSAFIECDSITSIAIPDSVKSIGKNAFNNCSGLTSVTIPDSVTSIGEDAFRSCLRISQVHITDIAAWCNISFQSHYSNPLYDKDDSDWRFNKEACLYINGEPVTALTIPDGIISIGNNAFSGCFSLTSVTIPDSVTSIGNYSFRGCDNLTSITIPESVTRIGYDTFEDCDSLIYNTYDNAEYLGNATNPFHVLVGAVSTSITTCDIYNSVKVIGSRAFASCTRLTSITISDSVTSIGEDAFYRCSSLNYNTYDNARYLGNTTNPYHVLVGVTSTDITTYEIHKNTKVIYSGAFYNCSNLTNIAIPEGVTDIGNSAFCGCDSLTDIVIPDSILNIGRSAFSYCDNLISVAIPNSVTSIEDHTFRDCISLNGITIPDVITSVGYYAFNDCYELEHIWYCGNENDRKNITVDYGNACFENAIWHYNCCDLEDHIFDTVCDSDCNICDYERTDIHVYDNACDSDCNECGNIRSIMHTYDNDCDTICNVCSLRRATYHRLYNDFTCYVCMYSIRPGAPVLLSNEPDTIVLQYWDELEYSIDGITWQKNSTFTGLSHLSTYTFYQRVAQSATALVSDISPGLTVTTIDKHTPDIPDDFTFLEVTDTSVRLNAVTGCEYSIDRRNWQTSPVFTDLTPGTRYTFYQRTAEDSKYYASPNAVLHVTTYSKLGTITYDSNGGQNTPEVTTGKISTQIPSRSGCQFIGWALTPNDSAVYSPGDCYNRQEDIVLYAVWAESCENCGGEGYYIAKCSSCFGTGDSFVPCSYCGGTGSSYEDQSCPVNFCYDGHLILDGSYKGICSTCGGDGIVRLPCNCSMCHGTGKREIGCNTCNGDGLVSDTCSKCISGIQVIKQKPPDIPELQSVSSKTVVLVGYSTCEYSIDGINWQDSNVFSNLNANESYSFFQRYKGTTYAHNSIASSALIVATPKKSIAPPKTPILESKTFHKVVLEKVDGCEYSLDGINWQTSNVFDDLRPSTSYTFYCRFAETDTHLYSNASEGLTVLTEDSPLFNVVFVDWNGTVISADTYHWGNEITVPTNPNKAADNTYTYTFAGWDKEVVACAGDATYTATYTTTYIDYTVVFKDWNGTALSTKTYHWGDTIVVPSAPSRPNDSKNSYTFTGWDKAVVNCAGNTTYTATYSAKSLVPNTITSSVYTVDSSTISKITAGTTVSSLLSGFSEGSYCKVYKGNAEVSGSTDVGTGMIVKIMDGNTVKASYTIIVTGDTNGDGNITVTDMIAIKAHVLKKSTLSGVYATAADTNGDNGISITDFIQVKAKILGKGTITAR